MISLILYEFKSESVKYKCFIPVGILAFTLETLKVNTETVWIIISKQNLF